MTKAELVAQVALQTALTHQQTIQKAQQKRSAKWVETLTAAKEGRKKQLDAELKSMNASKNR